MGYVDVTGLRLTLPDGRVLLDDVSFRGGGGACAALVGENGAGKTTLLRIISGDLVPDAGSVALIGGLGLMRQFIGSVRDDTTAQRLLFPPPPPPGAGVRGRPRPPRRRGGGGGGGGRRAGEEGGRRGAGPDGLRQRP